MKSKIMRSTFFDKLLAQWNKPKKYIVESLIKVGVNKMYIKKEVDARTRSEAIYKTKELVF